MFRKAGHVASLMIALGKARGVSLTLPWPFRLSGVGRVVSGHLCGMCEACAKCGWDFSFCKDESDDELLLN